jgi:hypothetical protein
MSYFSRDEAGRGDGSTAKLRLDAGKTARFSASTQSTGSSTTRCGRGARFTVAQDARRGDPDRTTTRNPGNVGLNKKALQERQQCPA